MTTSNTTIQTRYAETDQMGVIHHSQYLIWCEIGRTDFIEKLGFSYAQMEQDGLLAPVTEVNLQYNKRYGILRRLIFRLGFPIIRGFGQPMRTQFRMTKDKFVLKERRHTSL